MKAPKQVIEAVAAPKATPGIELIPDVIPSMPLPYKIEMVACGDCKHWRKVNMKAAVGQCFANAKFMSGPMYTTDMSSCSLGEFA